MIGLSVVKRLSKSRSDRPCGCSVVGRELEEVDDVDEADLQVREELAQHDDGRERFLRRDVAGAGHHDVGLDAFIVARLPPDADALRAVGDGLVHVHVLQVLLLVADDDVDVVRALEAVVGDAEQRVDVGREVDAADVGALVHDDVEETGVLVREAVVVLPPDGRRDQQVERRDRRAPRELVADRQPLGVLVEHRIDDVDEGFVRREEAVPAGEQVALQPALERVLGEHLEHAAVG